VQTVSAEPRPEHIAFVGTILPIDNPFWATHFPPNGWGCKCSVRQISEREALSLGYDPETGGPQIVWRTYVNRRTGERARVPDGIDPGWHTNPGLSRARTLTDRLASELRSAGPEVAIRQVAGFSQTPARSVLVGLPERGLSLPAGIATDLAEGLGANGSLVTIFAETARAKLAKGQTRSEALDRLPSILGSGTIVDEGAEARRTLLCRRRCTCEGRSSSNPRALNITRSATSRGRAFGRGTTSVIGSGMIVDEGAEARRTLLWNDGERWWSAVVLRAATGFMRVVTFHQISARQVRRAMERSGK